MKAFHIRVLLTLQLCHVGVSQLLAGASVSYCLLSAPPRGRHYSSLRRSIGVPWQVEGIQMPYSHPRHWRCALLLPPVAVAVAGSTHPPGSRPTPTRSQHAPSPLPGRAVRNTVGCWAARALGHAGSFAPFPTPCGIVPSRGANWCGSGRTLLRYRATLFAKLRLPP